MEKLTSALRELLDDYSFEEITNTLSTIQKDEQWLDFADKFLNLVEDYKLLPPWVLNKLFAENAAPFLEKFVQSLSAIPDEAVDPSIIADAVNSSSSPCDKVVDLSTPSDEERLINFIRNYLL